MELSSLEEDTIIGMLCDGLGIEDISVLLMIDEEKVRTFVNELRADGTLKIIYGEGDAD